MRDSYVMFRPRPDPVPALERQLAATIVARRERQERHLAGSWINVTIHVSSADELRRHAFRAELERREDASAIRTALRRP